jgi:hypothetical protein
MTETTRKLITSPDPKPAHTPGPWHTSKNFRYVRGSWVTTGDGPKDFNVCEIWTNGEGDDEQANANARLISAAPDLLAMCEQLLSLYRLHRPQAFGTDATEEAARAAIAKAQGK